MNLFFKMVMVITVMLGVFGCSDGGGDPIANETNGNSFPTATPISIGETYSGEIDSAADVDIFVITTNSSGTMVLTLTDLSDDLDIYLYDSEENELGDSSGSGSSNERIEVQLSNAGEYYIGIESWNGATSSYNLKVTFGEDSENNYDFFITSLRVGIPTLSIDGPGEIDGQSFQGNSASVYVEMNDWETMDVEHECAPFSCGDTYQRIWLEVNLPDGAEVDRYEWTILGWRNNGDHGNLAYLDWVIDIDIYNGRYIVATNGNNNKIRYDSQSNKNMVSCLTETIEVTAWSTDGRFFNGYFTIYLRPNGWGC